MKNAEICAVSAWEVVREGAAMARCSSVGRDSSRHRYGVRKVADVTL